MTRYSGEALDVFLTTEDAKAVAAFIESNAEIEEWTSRKIL